MRFLRKSLRRNQAYQQRAIRFFGNSQRLDNLAHQQKAPRYFGSSPCRDNQANQIRRQQSTSGKSSQSACSVRLRRENQANQQRVIFFSGKVPVGITESINERRFSSLATNHVEKTTSIKKRAIRFLSSSPRRAKPSQPTKGGRPASSVESTPEQTNGSVPALPCQPQRSYKSDLFGCVKASCLFRPINSVLLLV